MLYGGSLLWQAGRFRMCSAALCTSIAEELFIISRLSRSAERSKRIFTRGDVAENGSCSAASCGSAALWAFPTIATQNKKAIVFASLHQRWLRIGAADEARTRYLHLGKVALYQMSYGRISGAFIPAPSRFLTGPPQKLAKQGFVGKRRKSGVHHGSLACKTAR